MAGEARVVRAYRCRYCGAPLRVGPDTVVAICPYCGKPNWIRGSPRSLYAPRVPGPREAEEFFEKLVRRDPDLSRLSPRVVRADVVLLPFYRAGGSLEASYEAIVSVTVSVRRVSGGRVESYTRSETVRVSGKLARGFEAIVPGRRSVAEGRAATLLADRLFGASLESLEHVEWVRGFHEALAAEIDPSEAGGAAGAAACREARRLAESEARDRALDEYLAVFLPAGGEVTPVSAVVTSMDFECRPRVERVEGPLFAPLVRVYYEVEGRIYRAYFAWDGTPLYREEPMTLAQRIVGMGLASLIAAGGGAAAPLVALLFKGLEGVMAGFLLVGLASLVGRMLFEASLKPSRTETGVKSWLESLAENVSLRMGGGG